MFKDSGSSVVSDLLQQKEQYKQELLNILDDWFKLNHEVKPALLFTYDTVFGKLESELKKKSRQHSELERRLEILTGKIKRGERISQRTLNMVDVVVEKEFSSNSQPNHDNCDVNVNYEIPQLYRQLVKKLHPDANGNSELFDKYWNNVQEAYRTKNLDRLRMFYTALCENTQEQIAAPKLKEISLRTEIKQLEIQIQREKQKIEDLKNSDAFKINEKLKDAFWVTSRKLKLKNKIRELEQNIRLNSQRLTELTGNLVSEVQSRAFTAMN